MVLTVFAMNSVWPSAGERAAISVPMLLPPPGRFSTKKDCPSRSVSHCAMKRATRSVPPPAEVATRMRTGRDGYVSAAAMRDATGSAARPSRSLRRFTNARIGGTSRESLAPACGSWEQAVGGQKFDHVAVEQRRLLDLAGMAGTVEDLQFAAGDALLQRESGPVRVVLATGDDDGWTGDLGVMALGLGLPIGLELGDDGANIAEHVAIGEQVGEEMGHRRRAESGAEVLKGVAPTVADRSEEHT